MPDELYCYPGFNVLKNKMRIRDMGQPHEMERKLTMLQILELLNKPVCGAFDFIRIFQMPQKRSMEYML